MTPDNVELVVESASILPPPSPRVIALPVMIPPPAASISSVPPLKLSGPVPRLVSWLIATIPAFDLCHRRSYSRRSK